MNVFQLAPFVPIKSGGLLFVHVVLSCKSSNETDVIMVSTYFPVTPNVSACYMNIVLFFNGLHFKINYSGKLAILKY